MLDKQYHIIHNALPEELCDVLILDYFMYDKRKILSLFEVLIFLDYRL